MIRPPVIVSACLVGLKTRHDGKEIQNSEVLELLKGMAFIPVCPEQLGGLPTPRPAAEISGGRARDVLEGKAKVIDENGFDVTDGFLRGAREVLKLAKLTGATTAILKEKSPSCGVAFIYRNGAIVNGAGVLAELLQKEGIEVKGY
ncbi:DUF523 domain-containing protein [bacterium]|nr:MAG: DUF523 domain-containing protein [bacterium]